MDKMSDAVEAAQADQAMLLEIGGQPVTATESPT
jgi:hypothetical protein